MILFTLANVLLFLSTSNSSGYTGKSPGHLKPFGSGCPSKEKVSEIDGFPSPVEFFENFARKSLPLVMRNAARMSSAFSLWTDEYLLNHPDSDSAYVSVEIGKKETREGYNAHVSLQKYLKSYASKDIYLVNMLPRHLRKDVLIPCPLQCPSLIRNYFHTVYMWLSSGGTKSVVHMDDMENINCLIRGDKKLVMVDPHKHEVPLDRPDEGYSSVDVDSVDYEKYPWAANLEFYHVNITAGDCLYIPARWIHQVNSNGSNLAVNIWFNREATDKVDVSTCNIRCDPTTTLDAVHFFTKDTADILELFSEDAAVTKEQFLKRLLENTDLNENDEHQGYEKFKELLSEFDNELDADGDGTITKPEMKNLSPKRWHFLTDSLEALLLVLDEPRLSDDSQMDADNSLKQDDQAFDFTAADPHESTKEEL